MEVAMETVDGKHWLTHLLATVVGVCGGALCQNPEGQNKPFSRYNNHIVGSRSSVSGIHAATELD